MIIKFVKNKLDKQGIELLPFSFWKKEFTASPFHMIFFCASFYLSK